MANLRDIRRRIKSVKNTAQITKAMQLVAAAKMKKAQDQALAGRRYAEQLNRCSSTSRTGSRTMPTPLLEEREGERELMLVISTDKGLCGGLNTNLLRKVAAESCRTTRVRHRRPQAAQQLWPKAGATSSPISQVSDPVPFAEVKPIAKF